MYNTYNLAYQRRQDDRTQSNWEKEYQQSLQNQQWQQAFNEKQFEYQKERDAIADNQWQQQFNLSKKASSSSRSSGGSGLSIDLSNSDTNSANSGNYEQIEKGLNAIGTAGKALKGSSANVIRAKRDLITNALRSGNITPEEADRLIDKYNLD